MRNFYLDDFKPEVVDELVKYGGYDEKEIVAVPYNEDYEDSIPSVAGNWKHISQIIPLLKEMGYTDMNLYYEDCDIWVLKWHNPEMDNSVWTLIHYE